MQIQKHKTSYSGLRPEEWKAILDSSEADEPKKKKTKPAAKENKPVKKKTAVNQIKSMLIQ